MILSLKIKKDLTKLVIVSCCITSKRYVKYITKTTQVNKVIALKEYKRVYKSHC